MSKLQYETKFCLAAVFIVIDTLFKSINIFCATMKISNMKYTYAENLMKFNEGPCTVVVSWDAPFTLEGILILCYNVNIIIENTGEIITEHVTDTRYFRPFGYNFIINIAAVNEAGEGDVSVLLTIDIIKSSISSSVKRGALLNVIIVMLLVIRQHLRRGSDSVSM